MRLKDRVALITGGGSGIGKAMAKVFGAEGAQVVVASRTLANLQETVDEITAAGGKATAIAADISDEEQVISLIKQIVDEFGRIDVLVNNSAAMIPDAVPVSEMTLAHWNKVMSVNLNGTMLCTRETLRQSMLERKSGSIINISSIAGVIGNPYRSPYSVSKWGIRGFTETLAIEVGEYNIRVNSICPAATASERFKEGVRLRAESLGVPFEEQMGRILSHYSLKRVADPSEIGTAALFLASDDSSAITGQHLIVSCGFHMLNPTEIK